MLKGANKLGIKKNLKKKLELLRVEFASEADAEDKSPNKQKERVKEARRGTRRDLWFVVECVLRNRTLPMHTHHNARTTIFPLPMAIFYIQRRIQIKTLLLNFSFKHTLKP